MAQHKVTVSFDLDVAAFAANLLSSLESQISNVTDTVSDLALDPQDTVTAEVAVTFTYAGDQDPEQFVAWLARQTPGALSPASLISNVEFEGAEDIDAVDTVSTDAATIMADLQRAMAAAQALLNA